MGNFSVLISGKGTNLKAICESGLSKKIDCVISSNPEATGLQIAKYYNIPSYTINYKLYCSRKDFEHQLLCITNKYNSSLIVLAGFMRILSEYFITQCPTKIINIHPSLLPSFAGINAQKQAFDAKVKLSGVTIHFVTEKLDHGPIITQGMVPINSIDSIEDITTKILQLEHKLYPFIIQKLINNQVTVESTGHVNIIKDNNDHNLLGKLIHQISY